MLYHFFEFFMQTKPIEGPCGNEKCENTTDICVDGSCQCGIESGLVCDIDSEFPLCSLGACVCSKIRGAFELGDGTTRGSCYSITHKCHSSGECKGCISDGDCNGLSDKCNNFICGCGSGPACNSTISNHCLNGKCMCGDGDQCSTKMEIVAGIDPRDGSFGVQRTDQEVCEQVTAYYNPLFVYQHPLMKMKNKATFIDTGFDEDSTASSFILEYDDKKGCRSNIGKYTCLGMS